MNEPANLLEDSNSNCIGEIADENECTPDKNIYSNDELPYIPGYRPNVKETLSKKSISENALIYPNNTVYDTKPMISFYQTKYSYHYLNSHLNKRPFILSRSTSLGSGKYAFHWLGDNLSTFENLKNSISGIFNFNIFGIPFTGADICGFMQDASNNLCIRWYNLGVFYPFSRNHNFFAAKDQYPWSFNTDTINIVKKNINLRYSLLRYIYSQFFLISLNEKGSFFKPLMFEFPEDETSYEDIESKIMFGEAFLLCTFYENNENSKKFKFPNSNFNTFQTGKSIVDYEPNEDNKNKIVELSGKLDQIHIFLRGGYIVPYQDVFDKYILNTEKLRNEKLNLIVNIDNFNQSRGELFFDNDDIDTIKNSTYFRVEISYSENKLNFNTYKNRLDKYEYNDHILGKIEFWRINQLIEMNDKNENKSKIISLNVTYNENTNPAEIIEGVYDKENDKAIFEISKGDKSISIFDINEMEFI
jgi:alpha-glucosidase (family GH31 glycosyl hydrolase)